MQQFDREIEKFEKGQVEKTANSIKMRFKEFENMGLYYASHPYFNQFVSLTRSEVILDYRTIKKLMDILSGVINSSNYINDIFVYYGKSEVVLNYTGIYAPHFFYETGWEKYYEEMTGNCKIIDTRSVDNSKKFRRGNYTDYNNNVITFFIGIPYDNEKKLGTIVINLNYEIVSDILKNITNNSQSLAFLINEAGIVLSSNHDEYLYKDINEITFGQIHFKDEKLGKTDINLADCKMVCYYSDVDINGWKLCIMIPSNIIFKKSLEIRLIIVLVLITILIIIIIVSLLLSKKIYKPIKEITLLLKSETNHKNDDSTNNNTNNNTSNDAEEINEADEICDTRNKYYNSDIFIIKNGLKTLLQDRKDLEKVLDENRLLFREYFISNLITGKIRTREFITKKAEYFNIHINCKYYRVATIKNISIYPGDLDIEEFEVKKMAIINIVQAAFKNNGIDVICSQDTDDNILILIKIYTETVKEQLDSLISKCMQTIKNNIEHYLSSQVILGIGKMHEDVLDIELSYKESLKALKYSFIMGDIVDAYNINYSEDSKLFYPIEIEKNIISFIDLCDYENVILCINNGIKNIIDANKNIDHIFICFSNLINLVNRCMFEFNINPKNIMPKETGKNISINDFKNIEQFMKWLSIVFKKVVEQHIYIRNESEIDFSAKIRQYIEKSYMSDITLSSVSDHFGYNSSYFSRLFKEIMGANFIDYINQIRIEKAKVLLATTNISTQEIAEQVGFNNRISFVRSFKKFTTVNPGEYRGKKRNAW